jgi:RimJ/RimL family protein N-acetyltransferase
VLRGEKVLLRVVERRDVETFRKWLNDPEVNRYLAVYWPLTEAAEERWFQKTTESSTELVMAIESPPEDSRDGRLIGNCGFHGINWKDRTATLGIFIGEKVLWRSGRGTEAASLLIDFGFGQLNLRRVNSSVLVPNKGSLKMHEKLGFREEGRRRQNIFREGFYHDEVIFGLLREEWKK